MGTLTIVAATLAGCTSSDPCKQQPDSIFCGAADETGENDAETGETGADDHCIPHIPDNEIGYTYACHGTGNGWLFLDVDGNPKDPEPECVNWGPDGKPKEPTIADCVPLDLTMLPNDVPAPGACCVQGTKAASIEAQCADDCGYAACTLAIAKIREAAFELPHPGSKGVKKAAEERVRSDLFGLANKLELPQFYEECASQVAGASGKPTDILLGAGDSPDDFIGHINKGTLTLRCTLDQLEPFILEDTTCESTPNIPLVESESDTSGAARAGTVTIVNLDNQSVGLSNIEFSFQELYMHDGSVNLRLTAFDADAADFNHGSMSFIDPHIQLADPISAPLVDGTITFPAGTLRMEASSVIASNGDPLFGGERVSAVYANTTPALAIRTPKGGFAFVKATFEAGSNTLVLASEE